MPNLLSNCFLAVGLALSVVAINLPLHGEEAAEAKPNIVFILADDLGYGGLSCYGGNKIATPNMDRIATEGIKFLNAYSPHSVCTPSRYALMTGRYAWRTWNGHGNVWSNDPLLIDPDRITLPDVLKKSGYTTALIGKWHLGFGSPQTPGWDSVKGPDYNQPLRPGPLEVGFDYFYGIPHVSQHPHVYIENHQVLGLADGEPMEIILDDRLVDRAGFPQRPGSAPNNKFVGDAPARYEHEDLAVHLTEKAVAYLEQTHDDPFFLYFAHRNPHGPLIPNERFAGTSEIGPLGDFINELDWSVGEILNTLEREGLAENTIVFFSSDNGGVENYRDSQRAIVNGHYVNGPFFGQKSEVYEGGVHVPLLVRWPGVVEPGRESDHLVALSDVFATMAEFTNYSIPCQAGEDSFSYLHVLQDSPPAGPVRETLVTDSAQGLFGIRKGPWKLITGQGGGGVLWDPRENLSLRTHVWNYPEDTENPPGQLYNLEQDAGEQQNLYYEHPEIVVELRDLLRQIQFSGRSRGVRQN